MTDLSIAGPKPAISEIEPTQLAAWLDARGEPAYRAAQVLGGAHRSGTASFEELTDDDYLLSFSPECAMREFGSLRTRRAGDRETS